MAGDRGAQHDFYEDTRTRRMQGEKVQTLVMMMLEMMMMRDEREGWMGRDDASNGGSAVWTQWWHRLALAFVALIIHLRGAWDVAHTLHRLGFHNDVARLAGVGS